METLLCPVGFFEAVVVYVEVGPAGLTDDEHCLRVLPQGHGSIEAREANCLEPPLVVPWPSHPLTSPL